MSDPAGATVATATLIAIDDVSTTPVAGLSAGYYEREGWHRYEAKETAYLSLDLTASSAGSNAVVEVFQAAPGVTDPASESDLVVVTDMGDPRVFTAETYAGETYWFKIAEWYDTPGQYIFKVTRSEVDLTPVRMPNGRIVEGLQTSPDGAYYTGYLTQHYGDAPIGVWVGQRSGDTLVELGVNVFWASTSYPPYNLVRTLQWLDSTTIVYVVLVNSEYLFGLGKVTDAGVTFGPPTSAGIAQHYLSRAKVVGNTVSFLYGTDYNASTSTGSPLAKVSFDFTTPTPLNITTTMLGYTAPWVNISGCQFFDDGGYLIHNDRDRIVYKLRADGTTGPAVGVDREFDATGFQTMDQWFGSNSWVQSPETPGGSIYGFTVGDRYLWVPATSFLDHSTSEAVWICYDMETGTRDIYRSGAMGANWNYQSQNDAIYPGESAKVAPNVLWSLWGAAKTVGNWWFENYRYVVVDTTARTVSYYVVSDVNVDLGRFEGVGSSSIPPTALVAARNQTNYITTYAFYPANLPPVATSALKVVRRAFV